MTVENTTYKKASGAAWEGKLIDRKEIPITSDSTVMSAVVAALDSVGATQAGADKNYISSINGLDQMAAGSYSGWMGTLNDWFCDTGFGDFTVAKGTLGDGDEISMMYSVTGADLGGSMWGSSTETTVKNLGISAGTLSPMFDKGTNAYMLNVPADTSSVKLTPTATDKNFQVRTSVAGTEYKRSKSIPIDNGTVITVKCGDPAWPTMNSGSFTATSYTLTVNKSTVPVVTFNVTPADAAIFVADANGQNIPASKNLNEFTLEAGQTYTYTISKYGYAAQHNVITANGPQTIAADLAPSPANTLIKYDSAWPSFRNSLNNMGIVSAKTPRTANETELKWATQVATGYSNPVSSPIIVGDKIYVMVGSSIKKINKVTGVLEATTGAAVASGGYTVQLAYGEGMIFAPVSDGKIQAFDANTLQSLWVSEQLGGQTLTPITYANGYLYTGFSNNGASAAYVCLSVTDEDTTSTNEVKYPTWVRRAPTAAAQGYYWSGACVIGDAVVFGVDSGLLTSYSATQNKEIDTLQVEGDIRSSVAKDGDRIYFTTKAGKVYSVQMNADGTFNDASVKSGQAAGVTESTGTPVVYNGRVYVGGSGASFKEGTVAVMNAADMSTIYSAKTGGKVQSSALFSTAYDSETGKVYAYFTYNNKPGGITVLEDSPGQTAAQISELFVPEGDKAQYCICSPIADTDGTIYYKNDSGYLMAVGQKNVKINTAPARKVGIAEAANASVVVGNAYTLDLSTIFEDADIDPLTYSVSINGAAAVNAAQNYSYAASEKGTVKLTFKANDGKENSIDSYTVTLTIKATDAEILADIKGAVDGVKVSGTSGLSVRETDYDADGKEVSVTNIKQTWQLRMKRADIDIAVITSSNANVAADGAIAFTDTKVKGNVNFRFSKDGVSYEKEVLITIPKHTKTVQEQIDGAAAIFAADSGFDVIKGKNTVKTEIKESLNLQKSPSSYGAPLSEYSDVQLLWTSSDTNVINPPSYGSSAVKVVRPAKGQPDANINLSVEIKKGDYATGTAVSKVVVIAIVVPAITQAEEDVAKDAVDAALARVTFTGFTEVGSVPKAAVDSAALTYDVSLKNMNDLISAGMVDNNAVNKAMAVEWTTDGTAADGNYLSINSMRCNVMRTVGTADKQTNLILKLTYNGYSGTKALPVTIKGISQAEADAANAEMKAYEGAVFDGLKDKNTAADFITSDLFYDRAGNSRTFYRIHKENDKFVYTLKNGSCPANVGVEFASWTSSDPTVIGDTLYGGTANLMELLKRPSFGEKAFDVTLSSDMKSLRYGNVKNADGTPAVPTINAKLKLSVPAFTNELQTLTAEGAAFAFDASKDSFTAEQPVGINTINIKAIAKDPTATVSINGQQPNSEGVLAVAVNKDENTVVTIVTTVQQHAKTTTLTLTAPKPQPLLTAAQTKAMLDKLSAYQLKTVTNPSVGTTSGEWTLMALARYGTLNDSFKQTYLGNLYGTLEKTNGVLDKRKYTEYSRVALALSALGMDAHNAAGYDVLAPLADFNQVKWQGVNGSVWALIALDTMNYDVPKLPLGSVKVQTTREKLIDNILSEEISGGGWSMMGSSSMAEPDMTGMAIQALAPYCSKNAAVKAAVGRALTKLSAIQKASGSFGSAESDAQVIVALNAMNIALNDARFVKGNKTVLDGLMIYYIGAEGSFKHMSADRGPSAMATDQGMYALVSYYRSITGQTRLYDMTDMIPKPPTPDVEKTEREAVIAGINALPQTLGMRDKAAVNVLIVRLSKLSDFDGKASYTAKLNAAKATISEIEQKTAALDEAVWNRLDPQNITKNDAGTVAELMAIYNSIADADKKYLMYAQDLLTAQGIVDTLKGRVIPSKVFENIAGSDVNYLYEDASEGYAYTISINGKNVLNYEDMNAVINVGSADAGKIMDVMTNAYWLTLKHNGTLPAKVSVSTEVGAEDGDYVLYRAEGNEIQRLGDVTVKNHRLSFDTDKGGAYFINAEVEPKKAGDKEQEQKVAAGDKVKKSIFEEIKGKDINIKIEGKTKSGISYSMIFNGMDIKNPADFDTSMTLESENEGFINQLADNPFILHFAYSGKLPGKMLVELSGLALPDGDYLLFYYNEDDGRAEVTQKITVKNGSTKFFLEHCSDYFIAKSAKKSSIAELNAVSAQKPPVAEAKSAQAEADENESYDVVQYTPQGQFPWAVLIVIIIAAGAVGAFFIVRTVLKKRGEQ
ncbi:MAG: cadherin-like beta sandwich domain-containing protein [Christensenella sp.]